MPQQKDTTRGGRFLPHKTVSPQETVEDNASQTIVSKKPLDDETMNLKGKKGKE